MIFLCNPSGKRTLLLGLVPTRIRESALWENLLPSIPVSLRKEKGQVHQKENLQPS